jgi:hypothetical protein
VHVFIFICSRAHVLMVMCSCVHASMRPCVHACMRSCAHAFMRSCVHEFMVMLIFAYSCSTIFFLSSNTSPSTHCWCCHAADVFSLLTPRMHRLISFSLLTPRMHRLISFSNATHAPSHFLLGALLSLLYRPLYIFSRQFLQGYVGATSTNVLWLNVCLNLLYGQP